MTMSPRAASVVSRPLMARCVGDRGMKDAPFDRNELVFSLWNNKTVRMDADD